MAGAETTRSEEESPCPIQETDQAVDESSDVDGDFASLQKMLSQKRRAAKDSPEVRLQKALPFLGTFAPNIRPLTINDLEACIALENAAFPNPEHRASPQKASLYYRPLPIRNPLTRPALGDHRLPTASLSAQN
jgi:hypothetical protein